MAKQPENSDFIKATKASGKHFSDTSKGCTYYPTPSNSRPDDGHLGDAIRDKGPALWRPVENNPTDHTFTGSRKRHERQVLSISHD